MLRLLGVDGVDAEEVPIPNRVVEALQACGKPGPRRRRLDGQRPGRGRAERRRSRRAAPDPRRAAAQAEHPRWREAIAPHVEAALERIPPTVRSASAGSRRIRRTRYRSSTRSSRRATSTRTSSRRDAAARAGAQCIAVIRSTAQSLLDHVPLRRDDLGVRRDLRHAGELPSHARRARRHRARARPLRPPRQLLLGPLHARDRGHGRPRAAGHDAQRRALRHHLPRHQSAAHAHRPELLPPHQRRRRRRHQHRRGQLPDDRRRRRAGPRRPRLAVHQRAAGEGRGPRGLADRPRTRVRDRPRAGGRPALRDRAGGGRA